MRSSRKQVSFFDPAALALLPLLLLTLRWRLFPAYYLSLDETIYWVMAAVTVGIFVASAGLHEAIANRWRAVVMNLCLAAGFLGLAYLADRGGEPLAVSGVLFHAACANLTLVVLASVPLRIGGGTLIGLGLWQLFQDQPVLGAWLVLAGLWLLKSRRQKKTCTSPQSF